MEFLIYFILLALLAEIVGTIGGFGSSLLFVPIASYFFDFHSVLGITALYHLSSNISKIYFFRKGYDKKLILYIGIPAVIFVAIGAYLSKYLNAEILEILLSLFLILISLLFILKEDINFKPNNSNSIIGGTLSGLIAGILGTGGAIRGLTLAAYNLKPEVFIATSAIIDLGIDLSRTVVYGMNGYLHKDDMYLIPILFLVSIIGTFIGKKILLKIPEQQFKKIVLILIFITGVSTLLKVIL
ncbi:MAG: sulfite exporter TauE/SafE family protein [Flavobacterium sp.]|nr:sulfite exporter TauE/SafE family protein [Flavobacterium sp.]